MASKTGKLAKILFDISLFSKRAGRHQGATILGDREQGLVAWLGQWRAFLGWSEEFWRDFESFWFSNLVLPSLKVLRLGFRKITVIWPWTWRRRREKCLNTRASNMHSMFSEKGLIYQKLFIDNKCALNNLLLLVWWRKVYIESFGRRTPWVCLLPFSLGSSHYKPCIAGFLHFCSKDKCGKQNQLYRHHFVSLAVRIRNNFVAMKRFRVLIEKKNFFFKAKAGIKEILAEMSNSAVYLIHTVWAEDETEIFVSIFSLVIVDRLGLHIVQLKMQQDQIVYTGPLVDSWFWCERS